MGEGVREGVGGREVVATRWPQRKLNNQYCSDHLFPLQSTLQSGRCVSDVYQLVVGSEDPARNSPWGVREWEWEWEWERE